MSAAGRRTTALCALAVIGLVAGCGIGVDGEPRALEIATTTTTTLAKPSSGRILSILYYVNEGKLLPVATELPDRDLTTVLNALLLPDATVLVPNGTLSSIPAGTELLGVERSGDRLTIDLSPAFNNVVGLSRQQAVGQMVLTVTERHQFRAIEFRVAGEPIQVPSPELGDSRTVTDCDFAPLLATVGDTADAGLSPAMTAVLVARTEQLDDSC
ncbi:MAG: GerMN domain-containing protein [Microthrixaceae bacterium]